VNCISEKQRVGAKLGQVLKTSYFKVNSALD